LFSGGEAQEIGQAGSFKDHAAAFEFAMKSLGKADAVGHRVVHGGPNVRAHCKLNDSVMHQLREALPFAPLHLPSSLAVIDAVSHAMPDTPQVICLDTAFHRGMLDVAKTLPLPAEVRAMGVERYGFHGLSLESILAQLDKIPRRLVVAHLGNGSSITAIYEGRSVDTSMGLTPTGGVMMGSRTGDLDPGVMVYLLRHGYANADRMEELVDKQSGLKGVSGKSSDVRELTKAATKEADLALRMFAYQVRKTIAGMAAAMGGMDALVFTGGIGEHDAELREDITGNLKFCGQFAVMVLPAEEDMQIARISARILEKG
jgi:acetate kinase